MSLLTAAPSNRKRKGSKYTDSFVPTEPIPSGTLLAHYDPSDLSTLFQNNDFTNPVTASGQNVRSMLDKSGNGNHLWNTFGGVLTYVEDAGLHYLSFSGTNLQTDNFQGIDELPQLSFFAAFSNNGFSNSVLFSFNGVEPNRILQLQFYASGNRLQIPATNIGGYASFGFGSPGQNGIVAATPFVFMQAFDGLAEPSQEKPKFRVNRTERLFNSVISGVSVATQISDDSITKKLNLLSYSSSTGGVAAGKFFGAFVYAGILDNVDTATIENALAAKAGLPVFAPFSPVSATRWRLQVTLNNGHTNTCVVELLLLDQFDRIIPTIAAEAAASSLYSGLFPANQSFDLIASDANRWATANNTTDRYPCWLEPGLAGSVTPYKFVIYPYNAAGSTTNDAPRDFQMQYSEDDGDTWINHGPPQVGVANWIKFIGNKFDIVYPPIPLVEPPGPLHHAPFWRILITANNGHTDTAVAELEFFDVDGNALPMTLGIAKASSFYSVSYPPKNAFDATLASAWASANNSFVSGVGEEWLGMFYPFVVQVSGVRIKAQASGDLTDHVKDFQIQKSYNNNQWENVGSAVTGLTDWVFSEVKEFFI